MDLSNENVIHIQKDGVEYIQFKKLLEYQNIINHAYSIGIDKNYRTAKANKEKLDQESYQKAIKDYEKLCNAIGTNKQHIVKPNQDHTKEVKIVKEKIKLNEPDFDLEAYNKTDGLITNQKNIILATTNADCILLLFFDPIKKVIANTHSGWKGTIQRISVKTVEKMKEEFQCNPEDILCCICPSIRKCHFEVDKDVKEVFQEEFQDIEKIEEIITPIEAKQKWKIDTVKINQKLLEKQGLKPENIIDSGICSVCNCEQIHSYRVEGKAYGLNTALICLVGDVSF